MGVLAGGAAVSIRGERGPPPVRCPLWAGGVMGSGTQVPMVDGRGAWLPSLCYSQMWLREGATWLLCGHGDS